MKSYINKNKLRACIGLLLPLSLLLGSDAFGQTPSSNQNYVMETTVKSYNKKTTASLSGLLVDSASRSIQYFNGLGRPLQLVQWQGSPNRKDIVQPFVYDKFGREVFKYLPYADQSSSDGAIKNSPISSQALFYSSGSWDANIVRTSFPYSETVFEVSPLNRVLEKGAPGQNWQISNGHTQKISYETNIANNVKFYHAEPDMSDADKRSLIDLGYYTPNQLYVVVSKDENWTGLDGKVGVIEEFKDKDDRVVLKRAFNKTPMGAIETLSTYYVYDDLGNLSFVLPQGTNADVSLPDQTLLDNLGYQYIYDARQRLIEKKLPGKGWEYMVYNKLDQIVLTQDTRQKDDGKWLYTKYDAFGRVVSTGVHTNTSGRSVMQSIVTTDATSNPLWESRISGDYSNVAYPRSNIAPLTINYYDDYTFPGASTYPFTMASTMTKGLQTGSKINVLGTSAMLLNVLYYNSRGQLLKSFNQHYLGGSILASNYDEVSNVYNFAGEQTLSTRVHRTASQNTTIINRYVYDHAGRKQKTYQKMNSDVEVLLVEHIYNEIGQLKEKKLHNALQTTKFAYNERGWIKNSSSPEFSMKLGYDTLSNPQYNGNIRAQLWGASSTYPNMFNYSYDRLNRLTSAVSTGIVMSETINYDVMGNITSMNRDGVTGNYNYANGNKLSNITGGLATASYGYDNNGNATTDGRVGVTLTYNHLNLPVTASKTGLNLTYTYDAMGRKLKKVNSTTATTTEYIDGIQYTNGVIEFVQTEEGLTRNNSGTYSYEYNLTDHLGNVRYSFNKHPLTGAVQQLQADNYYAFGLRKVVSAGNNKYLYNSKELQEELGQYDYGARFYDPVIGRWNVVDPFSNAYVSNSPYSYVLGNPIANTDVKGMWTVSRHHRMTLDALTSAGIGAKQARMIAWYSSSYADNPGAHIVLNNIVHPFNMMYTIAPNRNMSGTKNSQVTDWNPNIGHQNYNIWHSMRSPWERENSSISEKGAMNRGMEWGWGQIFEASKGGKLNSLKEESNGVRQLGQGIHALQDAYAHKGTDMDNHNVWNDRFGDTSGAERISTSAVTVFKLLSGDYGGLGDKINISTTGMSKEQLNTVMLSIKDYMNHLKKKEEDKK